VGLKRTEETYPNIGRRPTRLPQNKITQNNLPGKKKKKSGGKWTLWIPSNLERKNTNRKATPRKENGKKEQELLVQRKP